MRRVVVTGMGTITPAGNDVAAFWDSLVNGHCGIDYITRFDTTDFKVKVAAEVKGFDPLLYLEKSQIRKTDLYAQYAIAAATQAVEDSGIVSTLPPERIGVYMGSGIGGMNTFTTECTKLVENGPKRISPFFIPMMISNIASGNVAIKYNFKGPALPVVTACATGTHSIGEAYRAIKHGYADAIVAGGSEAAINELSVAGFTNCMALTHSDDPKRASIPFDKERNGFVMGEGAGCLVLEEYEHAVSRNAKIYAEVVGYSNTCDAYHVTAPAPDGSGAAVAIKNVLDECGYEAGMKVYINAHGTSTPLNDKTETLAIKTAFGENASSLLISSTKAVTGHMLGAAGAVEAVAAIKAITDGIVPPTIGYKVPDEECDLNYVPNKAVNQNSDITMSTSLGFGGHNACLAFKAIK